MVNKHDLRAAIGVELLAALNRLGADAKLLAAIGADLEPADVYADMDTLGADPELLTVVGSHGDTLTDEEVLRYLKEWNAGRRCCIALKALSYRSRTSPI